MKVYFEKMPYDVLCAICLKEIEKNNGWGHTVNDKIIHLFHIHCIAERIGRGNDYCPGCGLDIENCDKILETNVKTLRWIQRHFINLGREDLLKSDNEYEAINVTKSPIEQLKKSKVLLF